MNDFETRLQSIEARNQRVEVDKKWEISWTRRGVIASVIYLCGVALLILVGHDGAWKHAFVPVMGYVISTLSLPPIKKWWVGCIVKSKTEQEIK